MRMCRTRRKILRNNERLAKASSEGRSIDVPRDQGYTRPTLLVLSPFRSSAYVWVQALFAASGLETLSGSDRLSSDFGPDPSVALSSEELPDKPKDFVQTFAGNTDDNFRFGIQLKRKEMRLWTGWYASDVILASPLGLRLALQKDGDADFLSSIEMLVVDQAEVMSMQNWDHVQHVLSRTSQIPQASHDTDFSRVRQWYLDDRALNLRQTILLSSYDMPELRAIYRGLTNVAGKNRSGHTFEGVLGGVREGLRQTFTRFDCANLNMEPDARFQHFTSRTLPSLLKSAVGATKTVIFVPSYFDFVRVEDHMKRSDLSFEAISEYSTPREVAQSRQAFFTGKRAFLIVTERSHFYKRNTYRGAQTLVFYALPENALFYSEILHWPFVPPKPRVGKDGRMKEISKEELENAKLDPTEVAALAVFSKFDRFRLERIVGDRQAARMITEERSNWKFA
ncbi:DUF1253-domain-containing protein [Ceraceosorus guamensis]|uniref:U3 small nucleolar RNA-associated protein 25 n=1 Tax=Ceraceosorus guamensis TaxID=1522189 RepID=A0A316VU98_9BASI|nr:DUF1253-domain-containing protein [Ceraceosorus guamensis]PWN39095.1 DUF1253-domain-containing protein [Ceraceosorus guamensis]